MHFSILKFNFLFLIAFNTKITLHNYLRFLIVVPYMKYRENTTDEEVIDEIFKKKVYDRNKFLTGDNWLDLGSHIGCFAFYLRD